MPMRSLICVCVYHVRSEDFTVPFLQQEMQQIEFRKGQQLAQDKPQEHF